MKNIFIILFCLLLISQTSLSQDKKKPAEKDKKEINSPLGNLGGNEPTYIDAKSLTLKSKERKFFYNGGVIVKKGEMTMTCDSMDGNYTEKNELDVVTGRKNVVIIRGDAMRATGDKAVYDAKTAIITLTGNPEVTEGESQLLADVVKIYVNEDKSEAEGNVKMKLVQKKTPAPAAPAPPATTP